MNESGRHPVNVSHLVMGVALLGLVTIWALVTADVVTGDDVRWLMPMPWLLAGAGGLLASVLGGRRRHAEQPEVPAYAATAAHDVTDTRPVAAPTDDTEEIR